MKCEANNPLCPLEATFDVTYKLTLDGSNAPPSILKVKFCSIHIKNCLVFHSKFRTAGYGFIDIHIDWLTVPYTIPDPLLL